MLSNTINTSTVVIMMVILITSSLPCVLVFPHRSGLRSLMGGEEIPADTAEQGETKVDEEVKVDDETQQQRVDEEVKSIAGSEGQKVRRREVFLF